MQIAHWTLCNKSGMHRVADSVATAESALGLDSKMMDLDKPDTWAWAETADVQVIHTHFPDVMRQRVKKPLRFVWVGHGTPDHVFQSEVEESFKGAGMWQSSPLQLMLTWLKEAHAKVTFWERHQWMYDRMLTVGARPVDVVPLGVDTAFWSAGGSKGKYAGTPSVLTCENPHYIKWPYDLLVAWSEIRRQVPEARLHAAYVPNDMHRTFFPFFHAMGSTYTAYIGPTLFDREGLRNALQSVDYYAGLVRYGDLNVMSLEAASAGAKIISYTGNPYASYWVPEGDQRVIASSLLAIFRGEVAPRTIAPVPSITDTASAMRRIYEAIV